MSSTLKPAISIIVPVYKAEKYLHRCVDSILKQTFKDFELILVDDGSPDKSGEICDEYANKDGRVIVIHKENEGVSIARNIGINIAKGEWIYFIDSDDWIDADLFINFISSIVSSIDLYFIGFNVETKDFKNIKVLYKESIFDKKESAITYLHDCGGFGVTWNKLFRNNIIKENNIRFNEKLNSYEDELFTLDYCKYVKCIKTISYSGYHYRYVSDGLSKRLLLPKERFDTASLLYKSMIKISKEKDFVKYSKEYFTFHIYDSFEQYYKSGRNIKLSHEEKGKFLLICYRLLHKNNFCKSKIKSKRIMILKILFFIKSWFIINLLFQIDGLRLRSKLSKNK